MKCATCGGPVLWQGPLTNLTHTKCLNCGAIDNQTAEDDGQPNETDKQADQSLEITMKLPEYADACDAIEVGYGTPLDRFIADNEPAGVTDIEWRAQLQDALDWAAVHWKPTDTQNKTSPA